MKNDSHVSERSKVGREHSLKSHVDICLYPPNPSQLRNKISNHNSLIPSEARYQTGNPLLTFFYEKAKSAALNYVFKKDIWRLSIKPRSVGSICLASHIPKFKVHLSVVGDASVLSHPLCSQKIRGEQRTFKSVLQESVDGERFIPTSSAKHIIAISVNLLPVLVAEQCRRKGLEEEWRWGRDS